MCACTRKASGAIAAYRTFPDMRCVHMRKNPFRAWPARSTPLWACNASMRTKKLWRDGPGGRPALSEKPGGVCAVRRETRLSMASGAIASSCGVRAAHGANAGAIRFRPRHVRGQNASWPVTAGPGRKRRTVSVCGGPRPARKGAGGTFRAASDGLSGRPFSFSAAGCDGFRLPRPPIMEVPGR